MNSARVYQNEEFWFVDYIDSNYELLPAVGVFKTKEEAEKSAFNWTHEEKLADLVESTR